VLVPRWLEIACLARCGQRRGTGNFAQPGQGRAVTNQVIIDTMVERIVARFQPARNLLPDSWPVRADLAELTGWAVQTKYPGEWPEPSAADAVRAESEARAVHNAIKAEFRCRGLYAGVK
ncbi:MAG: hypothetical protein OXK78_02135, partial [Caldilineaceae bacterium]|nr:hypothetical protein [Caldilineaceae bacterium]